MVDTPSSPSASGDETEVPTDRTEVLFDGRDLLLRADLTAPGPAVMVTFSPRRNFKAKKRPRSSGFGESLLAKRGLPFACFISKANHWWHTPELEQALALLRDRIAPDRRVVTYGVSMGAFGALISARPLRADHVLAFSPQMDVSGNLPLNPEWKKDLDGVAMLHDLAATPPLAQTRVTVIADPRVAMDQAHRRVIEALHPVDILPTPFSGHSSSMQLHEMSLLKPLVLSAIEGTLDTSEIRRQMRAGRLDHPGYCNSLGAFLKARGRPADAARANARCLDLLLADDTWAGPLRDRLVGIAVDRLIVARRLGQVTTIATRLAALPQGQFLAELLTARVQLYRGKHKTAVRHSKAAMALQPKAVAPCLLISEALMRGGTPQNARTYLDRALARKGGTVQEWMQLAEAFQEGAQPDMAALAHGRAAIIKPNAKAVQDFRP